MHITWPPKDPDETVAYVADWADQLGRDSISSYVMVVTSGDATVSKEKRGMQSIRFWIAGGTDGITTEFLCTVTTNSGQVLERSFSLRVADGESSFQPTSTTKRQLVEQMYIECALNGWEYDISAEEKDKALTRLDMLMWELRGRGIELGYNFPGALGQGYLDDELGVGDQAFSGLALLGAERLCPTMGKAQSKESRIALNDAMKAVRSAAQSYVPDSRLARSTPIGSGNKLRWQHFPFTTG